jgi:putative hydrolases of HD superfamily
MTQVTSTNVRKLLDFISLTHKFQQIKRKLYATGERRSENDSEHSFQLALVAWYILDSKSIKFDMSLVIKYALAHDLVEIYGGDTYFHTTDKSLIESKVEREQKAADRLKDKFPEFIDLHRIIIEYEEKSTPEANFIYALDKILPVINIFLDQGKSWQKYKVTFEMVIGKRDKIAVSKEALLIWEELLLVLNKNKLLFYQKPD